MNDIPNSSPSTPASSVPMMTEPGPASPGRAETGAWYDAPSTTEIVTGKLETPQGEAGTASGEQFMRRVYEPYRGDSPFKTERLEKLHELLDRNIGQGELNHSGLRNALLEEHLSEMQRFGNELQQHQRKVWDDLNATWKDQMRKDPEIGGARLNQSLATAKGLIEAYGGPPDQQRELFQMLDHTGMGNHPALIRLLNRVGKMLNEEGEMVMGNPSVPRGGNPGAGGRGWYGNSGR